MEKYLRNDIVDLLRNGFVADAYHRVNISGLFALPLSFFLIFNSFRRKH